MTQPSLGRGIALTLLAWSVFPILDAISKFLAADYHVFFVMWGRFSGQFLFAVLLVLPRGLARTAKTPFLRLQLLRSAGFAAHTVIYIFAILLLPLADASALLFTGPLMLAALSGPLLKERVSLPTWIAVLTGFAGAMIVARPDAEVVNWGAALVLVSTLCFALYQIATRSLTRQESPYTTLLYTPFAGMAGLALLLPWTWATPGMHDVALLLLMGFVGAVGHFLLIKGYEHAGAAQLAPYSYAHILMSAILGYAVFGDVPDGWMAAGAAIIAGSGFWLAWHEGVRA